MTVRCSLLVAALTMCGSVAGRETVAGAIDLGKLRIEGVDESLASRIEPALSIARLRGEQRRQVSAARLRFLLERSVTEARRALRPEGWYDAQVSTRAETQDAKTDVIVEIVLGEPVRVRALEIGIDGEAQTDKIVLRALRRFPLKPGDRFRDAAYEDGKRAIERALADRGYFAAEADRHMVEVSRGAHAADIALHWHSGARHAFGEVRFLGGPIRADLLARLPPWSPGAAYSQQQLLDLHNTLVGLDYFSRIAVRPLPEQASGTEVPVQIELSPGKREVYSAGLSYGTDSGAGLRLGAQRRWLNDRGHKAGIDADLRQRKRNVTALYRIPAFARDAGWYNLSAGWEEERFGPFDENRTWRLRVTRSLRWEGWQIEAGAQGERQSFSVLRAARRVQTLWYPLLGARTVHATDPVNPRRGWSLALDARGNLAALGSDFDFLQLHALGKSVHPLGPDSRLLLRGELGFTASRAFTTLPPDLRFFAGGDASIRGFGYQEVGVGADGVAALGGKHLAVGSVEVDHYFGKRWGAAAFVDAGDAFNRLRAIDPVLGVGVGLRWRSAIGPIRLDVARGFDNQEQAWRIHVRIGPDL